MTGTNSLSTWAATTDGDLKIPMPTTMPMSIAVACATLKEYAEGGFTYLWLLFS
jgi:hypothetical protein